MRRSIPALTSLRFFAAAMIVIQHTAYYFKTWESLTQSFVLIQGVTFFFVLSGFILTYTHSNLRGTKDSLKFIWARIARVWPAHIFVMAIFIFLYGPVFNTGYSTTTAQFWANATLTQAWSPYTYTFFAYNGVAWTLSVEMFFYALFPLLIINFSKTWHWKLALSISLIFIALALAKATDAKPFTGEDEISYASWLYIWPPTHLMEFVLGMIAGMSYLRFGHHLDKTKAIGTACGLFAIVVILISAAKAPLLGPKLQGLGLLSAAGKSWYTVSGAAPWFALGIFLLAGEKGIIQKALSWKPLILLGEISFSVYLTHQVIIRCIIMNPKWTEGISKEIQMGLYWAFTLIISYIVWRLIEKPSQRFMRSLVNRKSNTEASDTRVTGFSGSK